MFLQKLSRQEGKIKYRAVDQKKKEIELVSVCLKGQLQVLQGLVLKCKLIY